MNKAIRALSDLTAPSDIWTCGHTLQTNKRTDGLVTKSIGVAMRLKKDYRRTDRQKNELTEEMIFNKKCNLIFFPLQDDYETEEYAQAKSSGTSIV